MASVCVTLSYDEAEIILRALAYGGRLRGSATTDLCAKISTALQEAGDYAEWETRRSADLTADWARKR